jgi:SAM-dependent methyltransferase
MRGLPLRCVSTTMSHTTETPGKDNVLSPTGERMIPESAWPTTFWEHVYRYHFASRFVYARRVLDVACGEGYGAYALARSGARSIVGVEIAQDVCRHVRERYNIDALCADAIRMPFANACFDVVVSFETIEHLREPDAFVRECARVLDANGTLIISTPNRNLYNGTLENPNPFHLAEMTLAEFRLTLGNHFDNVRLFTQKITNAPWWSIRSLYAAKSPWIRLRGFSRICRLAARAGIRMRWNNIPVTETERHDAAGVILRRDDFFSSLFNPFAVRRASRRTSEEPVYYIAVCSGAVRNRW